MNAITDAINNLEAISQALDKFASKPENYNTTYASYLEVMGWEMQKYATDLKDMYG